MGVLVWALLRVYFCGLRTMPEVDHVAIVLASSVPLRNDGDRGVKSRSDVIADLDQFRQPGEQARKQRREYCQTEKPS